MSVNPKANPNATVKFNKMAGHHVQGISKMFNKMAGHHVQGIS